MTTNGDIPVGDTEMAECDGEEVVTMMDVLKEQQDFEDDANAVLGGSDDKECTYTQGYIKRQAIYACLTCCPESKDNPSMRAGFCLACSLTCHENHDLVELYTKRNFRCDCGNPKFKTPCQFTPNKPDLNDDNIYNQNFIGLYCICSKPYGDQESTLDDEMIQCIICEDWWHASHLDAVIPAHDQYDEMICKLCMAKNEFLHGYSDLTVNVETGDVDVVKVNGIDSPVTDEKLTNGTETDEKLTNGTATDEELTNGNKDSASDDMDTSATEVRTEDAVTNNDNEAISADKESMEPEKLNYETETEKPVENESSEVPMETDETDKAAEVIPEVNSEDKPETKNSEDSADKTEVIEPSDKTGSKPLAKTEENEPSPDKIEQNDPVEKEIISTSAEKTEVITVSTEKVDESNEASTIKTEESSEASVEKQDLETNESTLQTATDAAEILPTESKVNESSDPEFPSENASEETDKSSENIDSTESKVTEDKEIKVVKLADAEKEEIEQDSAAAESPSEETHDPPRDNTTDETKATETSQDEEMTDINKENEKVSDDIPVNDNISKVDENIPDSKENDSSKEIETNENKVPELANTEGKRKMSTEDVTDDNTVKKPKLDSKCVRPKGIQKVHKGSTFWPSSFRQKLCTCSECISMYKDLSVLFLTDLEDTVFAYEKLGKERTAGKPNQYEKGIEALCSLGRIQQIDALTEYNKMRDKLLTFLKSFKDRKEIVTENDIKSFFAGMKPEKRTDGVYFCR